MLDAITFIIDLVVMRPDPERPRAVRTVMWILWAIALISLLVGAVILLAG